MKDVEFLGGLHEVENDFDFDIYSLAIWLNWFGQIRSV